MKPSQLLALVLEKLKQLEKRLREPIEALRGRIEEVAEFKATPGPEGPQGPQGEPGEPADPAVVLELAKADGDFMEMAKGERGPIGLPGVDGKDGQDGRDGKDGQDGKDGKQGPKGDRGERGERGPQGVGMRGPKGEDGQDGRDGADGEVPEHQTKDGRIRFKAAGGKWGKWIDLKAVTNVYSGQGPAKKLWIDYAVGFAEEPTLLGTYGIGEVYEYTYTDETLYRVIGASTDVFYSYFANGEATGEVVARAI